MGLFPFLFIVLLTFGHAADVKGAIDLDSVSFPKIVGSSHFDVLVKFDKSYPYGDKEDQYKEFVKTIGQVYLYHLTAGCGVYREHKEAALCST